MNTEIKSGNSAVANTASSFKYLIGTVACVAIVGGAAVAIAQGEPMAVPANLAASSMEGRVIVAFDSPTQRAVDDRYRVFCSAVGAQAPSGQADARRSPAVIEGLVVGKSYDCRASAMTARGTSNDSKSVRVRVMGAD